VIPRYPQTPATRARRTYQCPNGHTRTTPNTPRPAPTCQHCSTSSKPVPMTRVNPAQVQQP